jgi:hypothetical protein
LSARYGLIESSQEILSYDCRMTKKIAEQLRPAVLSKLESVLLSRHWRSIGICLGKTYELATEGMASFVPSDARLAVLGGGLGLRLTRLHRWLRTK